MTLLNYDARLHSGNLPSEWGLRFGKRNAAGNGTDQARYAEQMKILQDPKWGYVIRSEVRPGDVAQWAPASASQPCTALVGSLNCRIVSGDIGFFHIVFDPHEGNETEDGELVWELHDAIGASIAPLALLACRIDSNAETVVNGQIVPAPNKTDKAIYLRVCTDNNESYWHPNIVIPGMQPVPLGPLHALLGINFQETPTGWLTLKMWEDGKPVPAVPNLKLTNIATIDYKGTQHDSLYPQWGNYGYPGDSANPDVVTHMGWTVRPTEELALADFPTTSAPTGFKVTTKSEDAQKITLSFNAPESGDLVTFPLIDDKPYLADAKMHPNEKDDLVEITIGKPQDGKKHTYGVDIHKRIARDSTDTPS